MAERAEVDATETSEGTESLPAAFTGDWKREFERICSQTDAVAAYSEEEIRRLIDSSESLLAAVEKLESREAKIYVFLPQELQRPVCFLPRTA